MDRDGDKHVHYDELRHVAYVTLRLKPSELPEARLRALWVVLDKDESNAILMDELAPFLSGHVERIVGLRAGYASYARASRARELCAPRSKPLPAPRSLKPLPTGHARPALAGHGSAMSLTQ